MDKAVKTEGEQEGRLTVSDRLQMGLFAGIFLGLLILGSALMQPTRWFDEKLLQNRNARSTQMREQKEDTIDLLNLGDSLSVTGFTPMELWKERGYTSFNIGADGIHMSEAYYALVEACSRQHPKYALLESLTLIRYNPRDDRQMVLSQPLYHTFDLLKYHSHWKRMIEGPGVMIYHRGYVVNGKSRPYEGDPNYLTDREIGDVHEDRVPDLNRYYFRRMHEFCADRDITLVIYSMPSPKDYSLRRVNVMEAFAREEGVPYVDLNRYVEDMGIDWSRDTSDRGDHLNVYGASKATVCLADRVLDQCTADGTGPALPDHRGEPGYEDWEAEVSAYDQLVIDMEGKNFGDVRKELKQKDAEGEEGEEGE